jgi:hypothetical protein
VDIFSDELDASLPPRPKLWAHEIEDWNAAAVKLSGKAEVEIRKVDQDCGRGAPVVNRAKQLPKFAVDLWKVTDNFCEAHDCNVASVNDGVEAGCAHTFAANPKNSMSGLTRRNASMICAP